MKFYLNWKAIKAMLEIYYLTKSSSIRKEIVDLIILLCISQYNEYVIITNHSEKDVLMPATYTHVDGFILSHDFQIKILCNSNELELATAPSTKLTDVLKDNPMSGLSTSEMENISLLMIYYLNNGNVKFFTDIYGTPGCYTLKTEITPDKLVMPYGFKFENGCFVSSDGSIRINVIDSNKDCANMFPVWLA